MSADVIVIGAGYGGLTAAAILAHNGVEVEVLEATGHLGGGPPSTERMGFSSITASTHVATQKRERRRRPSRR